MSETTPFTSGIYFTGAPASGLEEIATGVHSIIAAATGSGIPLLDMSVWLHPESTFLAAGMDRAEEMIRATNVLLGAAAPWREENCYHLLRGVPDVLALAKMTDAATPLQTADTCLSLIAKVPLVLFQMPDRERWRARGINETSITWFARYTAVLLQTLRDCGVRQDQFRVLAPPRGDFAGSVVEACWRAYGAAPNPLRPSDRMMPLRSAAQQYQTQNVEVFEGKKGNILGTPHILP